MRITIAAFGVALLFTTLLAPTAGASPTEVNVRIEGKAETLFEGPISTVPHRVRASSDSLWRRCNGINLNDPLNATPAPVPTSAAADAMRVISETFNGQWYNQYEDYFVTRWGPDEQSLIDSEQWGVVVNNVFTSVGGCQYQLDDGDEVLWVYDAFGGRPRLSLYPADYSGGATPLTATAELGHPFEVEVDAWNGYNEGSPPPSPQRNGSTPFQGAEVAPVTTGENGFEKVEVESSETVTTGANGKAVIDFPEPGWYRIKATAPVAGGEESAVRSNRLDVCVPQPPASSCAPPLADDQVRTPPPPVSGEEEPEAPPEAEPEEPEPEEPGTAGPSPQQPGASAGGQGAGVQDPGSGAAPAAGRGQVRLQLPRLGRSGIGRGLVKVSWRVLDPGVGIQSWAIFSQALGRRGARHVSRAMGASRSSATLRLPAGATYRLWLTVTDALGRSTTVAIGKVRVPEGDARLARRGGRTAS
jgi:hypothetical protein